MRVAIKFMASASVASAMCGAAWAQELNVSCVRGDDSRTIEVIAPGVTGQACDVRYTRDSGRNVRTPYHANHNREFCQERAGEIVSALINSGFACGQRGGVLTAEARSPSYRDPEPTLSLAPAETSSGEDRSTPTPTMTASPVPDEAESVSTVAANSAAETVMTQTPSEITPAAQPTVAQPVAVQPVAAQPVAAEMEATEMAPLAAPQAVETNALPDSVEITQSEAPTKINNSPAPAASSGAQAADRLIEPSATQIATGAPASLAGPSLETFERAARPIPAGRLVGAEPVASTSKVQAPGRNIRRSAEEVIIATLYAQAAAWNEGNLQAYMETYWNDTRLKFVFGTEIMRGWSPIMRDYKERYADGSGLGELRYEKVDVQVVSDDVAVVTGRYNHEKPDAKSTGIFSLVMRRDQGVWRIVHDHSAADQ